MAGPDSFLVAIAIIFILPYLVWRWLGLGPYAPLAVVQIVAGILLGPGVFGAAAPEAYASVFDVETNAALGHLAAWAATLFVWTAGVELDLGHAWRYRRDTVITASLALVVPLLLGCLVAAALLSQPGWLGPAGEAWQALLGIGMAAAVTSLPVLLVFMEELDILSKPLGQRVLRYASLDDIAIWGVLALTLFDWALLGWQLSFFFGFVAAAWLLRRLLPRLRQADRWHVGLVALVLFSLAADAAGLHYTVGAFLAGAVIDSEWLGEHRVRAFRGHVLLALMPVFFLSTGLRTDWEVGGPLVLAAAGAVLVASVVGKLAGIRLAGRMLGWNREEASLIGWLLQTKGLIMIVFAAAMLDTGIISNAGFTALLIAAVASTALTVPVVLPKLARLGGKPADPNGASRSAWVA